MRQVLCYNTYNYILSEDSSSTWIFDTLKKHQCKQQSMLMWLQSSSKISYTKQKFDKTFATATGSTLPIHGRTVGLWWFYRKLISNNIVFFFTFYYIIFFGADSSKHPELRHTAADPRGRWQGNVTLAKNPLFPSALRQPLRWNF